MTLAYLAMAGWTALAGACVIVLAVDDYRETRGRR